MDKKIETNNSLPPPLMLINTSGSQSPRLNSNVESHHSNRRQHHATSNQLRHSKRAIYSFEKSLNIESSVDYPSFVELRAVDGAKPLSRCCLFAVDSEFRSACGAPKQMWAQNDGSLVVEVSSLQQYQKVCTLTSLGGSPLSHGSHPTLNVTKGVIYSKKLLEFQYTEDKLKTELACQKVTAVHHVHRSLNGNRIPTATYILSFSTAHLPEKVIMGYEPVYIRPFISKPRRCIKCQRFGHIQKTCRWESVCCNCAQSPQHGTNCSNASCCANCGGSHAASSQSCIKYKFEADVLSMRDNDKISFQEARRRVRSRFIRPNLSFAEALASSRPPFPGRKIKPTFDPSSNIPNRSTGISVTSSSSISRHNITTASTNNMPVSSTGTEPSIHSLSKSNSLKSNDTSVTFSNQQIITSVKSPSGKFNKNKPIKKKYSNISFSALDSSPSISKAEMESIDNSVKFINDSSQIVLTNTSQNGDINTVQVEPTKRVREISPSSSPVGKRSNVNAHDSTQITSSSPEGVMDTSNNFTDDELDCSSNLHSAASVEEKSNNTPNEIETDQFVGFPHINL